MANKKTSKLTVNPSPSTSATLVGVDNGETVQIPINFFQELIDGKLPYLNILWNSPTDTISIILDALVEADLLLASYKPVVRLYGYGSALLLCSGGKGADGICNLFATNLYDGKVVQSVLVDPTTVTISDFLAQESVSTYQEQINEIREAVEGKAESDHGHSYKDLTDKPMIPSVEGLASETYVDGKVAGIVNSAPETLDTLNELSKALGNDPNFAASVATQIGNKVDKVSGKGLSTNDYTTEEKNKLAGLSTVATSGSYNDLKDKPSIPSAYSHPASHPASMITGLAKVATSGSYNDLTDKPTIPSIAGLATEKYVDNKIANLPSGGGNSSGGGTSIIYATELPSTPAQAIYVVTQDEVVKAELYSNGVNISPDGGYCEIVDVLPEVGNCAMDLTTKALYTYYLTTDGELYGYVDAALEAAGGVPVGWYPVAPLFGAVGTTYGGTITSMSEVTDASATYALVTTEPKTRVYVPMQDGTFLELTSGIRTRFDEYSGTASITEV